MSDHAPMTLPSGAPQGHFLRAHSDRRGKVQTVTGRIFLAVLGSL